MNMPMPEYRPPQARRAAIAVGLAPILVLVAFTLNIGGLIEVDIGFVVFAACTAWVVVEMHQYQKALDGYDAAFVNSHLSWRAPSVLRDLAQAAETPEATRDLVANFLVEEQFPIGPAPRS